MRQPPRSLLTSREYTRPSLPLGAVLHGYATGRKYLALAHGFTASHPDGMVTYTLTNYDTSARRC